MAKKKGGPSHLSTIITAALTIVIGIVLIAYFTGLKKHKPPAPGKTAPPRARAVKKSVPVKKPSKEITIYLSDPDGGYLTGERRSIELGKLNRNIAEAINRLITDGAGETLPHGTELVKLGIEGRTAYADFNKALKANHSGGSTAEINTVYAIVNTVTLNFPEIETVQILVDGKAVATLAGHIDISRPIGPEMRVINP